jgi:hypothetical protein
LAYPAQLIERAWIERVSQAVVSKLEELLGRSY